MRQKVRKLGKISIRGKVRVRVKIMVGWSVCQSVTEDRNETNRKDKVVTMLEQVATFGQRQYNQSTINNQ